MCYVPTPNPVPNPKHMYYPIGFNCFWSLTLIVPWPAQSIYLYYVYLINIMIYMMPWCYLFLFEDFATTLLNSEKDLFEIY